MDRSSAGHFCRAAGGGMAELRDGSGICKVRRHSLPPARASPNVTCWEAPGGWATHQWYACHTGELVLQSAQTAKALTNTCLAVRWARSYELCVLRHCRANHGTCRQVTAANGPLTQCRFEGVFIRLSERALQHHVRGADACGPPGLPQCVCCVRC
jgi:hypothetical protein